jgi:transcriptional regulatory protein RtcR
MGALAGENPIGTSQVEAETHRLKETWKKDGDRTASQAPIATVCRPENPDDAEALLRALLTREQLTALDRIEHVTLAEVVRVCRGSRSLADAGRTLYNVSGDGKNPSDRLRKFLKRHHLDFHALSQGTGYTC